MRRICRGAANWMYVAVCCCHVKLPEGIWLFVISRAKPVLAAGLASQVLLYNAQVRVLHALM